VRRRAAVALHAEESHSLGRSIKTVESHRISLSRKLAVHNVCELIVTALRHRLIAL
jgi:DNA-binding NarL/FixJ family response regulator